MSDATYINDLLNHIYDLQSYIDNLLEENAELYRQNQSYKMWMDRSIQRVKEMQN